MPKKCDGGTMLAQGNRAGSRRIAILGCAMMSCALMWPLSPAHAQRPVLAGRVSPSAVGAPVQQPAPIGGLRTTPLSPRSDAEPVAVGRRDSPRWLAVADARVLPYGVAVATSGVTPAHAPAAHAPAWMPSYVPPRWVADSTAPSSPLWRDLIVTEVWCSVAGACLERPRRLRARWIARCDCYAFADAWNRIWRVGRRGHAER